VRPGPSRPVGRRSTDRPGPGDRGRAPRWGGRQWPPSGGTAADRRAYPYRAGMGRPRRAGQSKHPGQRACRPAAPGKYLRV